MAFARIFVMLLLIFPQSASAQQFGVGLIEATNFPVLPGSTLSRQSIQNPGDCSELQNAVDYYISNDYRAIATNIWCDAGENIFQDALDAGLQVVIFEPLYGQAPAPEILPDAIRIGYDFGLSGIAIDSLMNGLNLSYDVVRGGEIYTWCPFSPDPSRSAATGMELPLSISLCPQHQSNVGDWDLSGYLSTVAQYLDAMNTHLTQNDDLDGFDPASVWLPDGVVVNGHSIRFPPQLTIVSRPDLPIQSLVDSKVVQIQSDLDSSNIRGFLDSMLTDYCPDCGGSTTTCETVCPSRCNNTCDRCGSDNSGYKCSTSGIILP